MHSANRDTLTHVRTHGPHLAEIYGDHRLAEGQHTPRLWPNQVIQTKLALGPEYTGQP